MFYLKNANLVLCNGKASTTGCDFVRRLSGNREMAIASFVPKLDVHYSLQPAPHTPCNIVHSCYYCNNKKNKNHFTLHKFTDYFNERFLKFSSYLSDRFKTIYHVLTPLSLGHNLWDEIFDALNSIPLRFLIIRTPHPTWIL